MLKATCRFCGWEFYAPNERDTLQALRLHIDREHESERHGPSREQVQEHEAAVRLRRMQERMPRRHGL